MAIFITSITIFISKGYTMIKNSFSRSTWTHSKCVAPGLDCIVQPTTRFWWVLVSFSPEILRESCVIETSSAKKTLKLRLNLLSWQLLRTLSRSFAKKTKHKTQSFSKSISKKLNKSQNSALSVGLTEGSWGTSLEITFCRLRVWKQKLASRNSRKNSIIARFSVKLSTKI